MTTPKVFSYFRFSSDEQAKGHSLERQIRRAQEWCEARGLTLEESFSDEGMSGYDGSNLKGAFGRFLAMVESGFIPEGSILLVEQLDRLTRMNLDDATDLIRGILKKGITIIALATGKEYRAGQGLGSAIDVLIALEGAHQESEKKADRLRQSWKKRVEKAGQGEIIGRSIPGWLKVGEQGFELVPDRVELVREMFTLADQGMGVQGIATALNKRSVPTWRQRSATTKWGKATIHKLLTGQAPLGTLVVSLSRDDGSLNRKEITGYFPRIIDDGQWHRVQRSLAARTNNGGKQRAGRKGSYRNLFAGVSVCGYCGGRMTVADAGTGRNGKRFRHKLVCSTARFGGECEYHTLQYQPLEDGVIRLCREIDYSLLIATENDGEITSARQRVGELTATLSGLEAQIDNELALKGMVTSPAMRERLAQRLDLLQGSIEATQSDLADAELTLERLSKGGNAVVEHLETLRRLATMLNDGDEERRIDTRRKMRLAMTQAIATMTCYPYGIRKNVLAFDGDQLIIKPFLRPGNELDQVMLDGHCGANTGRDHCCVLLRFRNGFTRLFRWDATSETFYVDSEVTADTMIVAGLDFGTMPDLDIKLPQTPRRRAKVDKYIDHLTRKK